MKSTETQLQDLTDIASKGTNYWVNIRQTSAAVSVDRSSEGLAKKAIYFQQWLAVALIQICAAIVVQAQTLAVNLSQDYAQRIKVAKPGDTVRLPPGTFSFGDVEVPAGVSVRGAGHQLTIINASGFAAGLIFSGKGPATVADLQVREARESGLVLDEASGVSGERLTVGHCGNGIIVRQADNCTLRNVIVAENRVGVAFNNSKNCALVNATLANNNAVALILADNKRPVVFNNIISGSGLGVNLRGNNADVVLEHNLYACNYVGRMGDGHPACLHLGAWRDLSGMDRHSLAMRVDYADVPRGNFHPVSILTWAPVRSTASDWGVEKLAGVMAPERDIDGAPRQGGVDLGAYESSFISTQPPAGKLTVKSGAGLTSAGLYTKNGRMVNYLFQNQPLARGKHAFWLPTRDWQGRPIDAGDFEVRVVESDLRLKYIAPTCNTDLETSLQLPNKVENRATMAPQALAYDTSGRVLLAQDGFEVGVHLRLFDAAFQSALWALPGAGLNTAGMALTESGRLFVMRRPHSLISLDAATGKGIPFVSGSMEKSYAGQIQSLGGMSILDGKLYLADPKANQLVCLAGEEMEPVGTLAVPSPTQTASGSANHVLWVISEGKELLALKASGEVEERTTPVPQPAALAVNNGRMAVYSAAANQIAILDCSHPAALKLIRTIGNGGDGFGPIEPDRFWKVTSLALSAQGELAVADPPRVILFNPDGTVKRQHLSIWGQQITWGRFADGKNHFFQLGGGFDYVLDAKSRSWAPGTHWKRAEGMETPLYYFANGQQNYGVYFGKAGNLVIAEMLPVGSVKPLMQYRKGPAGLMATADSNGDGRIDQADSDTPVLGKDGQPITAWYFGDTRSLSSIDWQADGSLIIANRELLARIPLRATATGIPEFDFAAAQAIAPGVNGSPTYRSPYDFKTEEKLSLAEDMAWFGREGFAAVITTKTGAGPDLCTEHAIGTSMAGFDATGQLRWFNALNPAGLKMGFWGITSLGGITFAGRGAVCEYETMDRDGLGTGTLGTPAAMSWGGFWLDNHRQTHGFTADDGTPYLVIGDYSCQAYHWLQLQGADKLIRQVIPLTLPRAQAAVLAAEPPQPVPAWPVPPIPSITIKALKAPLTVDGDVEKWRRLGIKPIVITPDVHGSSPTSSSAIARLAYYQDKLYVQVIKFDDVVTFHQNDKDKHYLQDGIEMAINSYPEGFKYNVTRLDGTGDVVFRDTWRGNFGHPDYNQLLSPEMAPRVIKVLNSAEALADRKLIETAHGVDLGKGKAVVMEFMIPRSATTPMERQEMEVEMASGRTCRIGFSINDNDQPGSDALNPIVWPITYATFERPDRLSLATFE